jgi:hypothetical protein
MSNLDAMNTTSAMTVAAVSGETPAEPWERRSEQLREQEWAMAQKLLTAAGALLRRVLARRETEASVNEITRMLDLASRLGRLATGLQTERTEITGPDGGPISLEVEVALRKIYGEPLPGEVIDCAVVQAASPVRTGSTP